MHCLGEIGLCAVVFFRVLCSSSACCAEKEQVSREVEEENPCSLFLSLGIKQLKGFSRDFPCLPLKL